MTEYAMRCRTVHSLIAHAHLVCRLGRRDALPRDGGKSGAPTPLQAAHWAIVLWRRRLGRPHQERQETQARNT